MNVGRDFVFLALWLELLFLKLNSYKKYTYREYALKVRTCETLLLGSALIMIKIANIDITDCEKTLKLFIT
jgi:hypothetical protein